MSVIKIYKKEYELPVLANEQFQTLQQNIRARHQVIKQGARAVQRKRRVSRGWGPFKREELELVTETQELSFEERFRELKGLIRDYETIIKTLQRHKAVYQTFFGEVAHEVREVVAEKSHNILQLEQERLDMERYAQERQKAAMLSRSQDRQAQLLQWVRVLGQAALLLLKKLDLCKTALDRLSDDQQLQKQVLENMVEDMQMHYKEYEWQQRVNQLGQEISELANLAMNFEDYMREYFGPFQELIEQVAQVDSTLSQTVSEIQQITTALLHEQSGTPLVGSGAFDDHILDFLVQSRLKRERLVEVLEQVSWEHGDAEAFEIDLAEQPSESPSIADALANIQTLIEVRLPLQAGSLPDANEEILYDVEEEDDDEIISEIPCPGLHDYDIIREEEPDILANDDNDDEISSEIPYDIEEEPGILAGESYELDLGQGVILEMVWIPPGKFWMGATEADQHAGYAYDNELPRHQVEIAQGFWMGKYAVTQEQWLAMMGQNPSYFNEEKVGDEWRRHPVEQVSWDKAQKFIRALNKKGQGTYRLPTEAEWEYACRAGAETIWYFGNDEERLKEYAWYGDNSKGQTHPVGQLQPNAWSLYDMHGNVWEWCTDSWHDTYEGAPDDGSARGNLDDEKTKVMRGGAWGDDPHFCRSACRSRSVPDFRFYVIGVRVVVGAR